MSHQELASKAETLRYQKEYQKMYRLDVIPIPYIFYPIVPRSFYFEDNLIITKNLFLKKLELPPQ
jgi:hypothetical protein